MSLTKRPGSETYSYDFVVKGVRYSGNTGCTTKREAERVQDEERRKAKEQIAVEGRPMTMGVAVSRYWGEVGQHHANSDTTLRTLAWLEKEIGKNKLISEIRDADIARMVAKRRLPTPGKPAKDGKPAVPAKQPSAATVNRGVTQPMRALLTRAAETWDQTVNKIKWPTHMLKEPQERVRELLPNEEAALFTTLREDYHPIVQFSLLTGCRMQECLDLEWKHLDWHNRLMRVTGKGNKTRSIPMSDDVFKLLRPLPHTADRIFTYKAKRATKGETKTARGEMLPIEREGLKSIFERAVDKAGIIDFSFHDLRHTCATRLLRATGNLRLVKDLLGHEDMATTLKYAHITTDDLRDAMNATAKAQGSGTS